MYIQLQKTGCSHVARALKKISPGGQMEMHTRPTREILESGRLIAGSVRNPWDWYVSMWGYGCDGKGALFDRLTGRPRLLGQGYRRSLKGGLLNLYYDLRRDSGFWRELYSDPGSPRLFREWLRALLDSDRSMEIGEGYSTSPLRRFAGLYTFRYCRLFHDTEEHLYDDSVRDAASLELADREHNCVRHMIMTENIVDGIVEMLRKSGVDVTDELRTEIGSMERTNPSSRKEDYTFYYDEYTSGLVADRDSLIVKKHGYGF